MSPTPSEFVHACMHANCDLPFAIIVLEVIVTVGNIVDDDGVIIPA